MVAILFLVGEGKESPEIVTDLLDLEKTPRRPNYEMASDAPLLLYRIHYDSVPDWGADPEAAAAIADLWEENQRSLLLRAAMVHTMRAELPTPAIDPADNPHRRLSQWSSKKSLKAHVPLAQRPTHESVEVRTKGKAK